MGTPGLRLIQDLLAKSVAKWSGDTAKSTEYEKKKSIKIETNDIKVEYIETETVPHDVKLEADKIKEESCQRIGSKRKWVETETDKSGKKKKKVHTNSKCGSGCEKDETDEIQSSNQKDEKSLIMSLLKKSAAKFTEGGDDLDNEDKMYNTEKIQRKKTKICKKEINIKTETMGDHDDKKHSVTGVKMETQINQSRESIELQVKDIDEHEISNRVQKKTNFKRKFFSPEEDEILQHAIDSDNINCKDLAEQLGRTGGSIDTRIRRLKCGGRKFVRRDYSLVEDLLIMDRMLERLPGKRLEDLEMLVDSTTPVFLTTLGRTMVSGPMYRWGIQLKPWILQHYAGTLNLDIKRMLAHFVADNFDSFDSIDWALVVQRSEFAGHTLSSLKHMFYGNLFNSTKKHHKLEPAEVTLRNIVDNTGVKQKVTEKVLIRQKQVIDYFEQYVKKHGIANFL